MQLLKGAAVVAAGVICCATLLAVTPKKKPAHHKAAAAVSVKKPAARKTKSAAGRRAASTRHTTPKGRTALAAHGKRKTVAHSTRQPAQSAPTPDRYKQIQEALARKGYLHEDPSGVWDQNSIEALRHFQQDQNLQASGKLDSLSIIALGLGPKY